MFVYFVPNEHPGFMGLREVPVSSWCQGYYMACTSLVVSDLTLTLRLRQC